MTIKQAIENCRIVPQPPCPQDEDDAFYIVWLFEISCINVARGIGGLQEVREYGALKHAIADLLRENSNTVK